MKFASSGRARNWAPGAALLVSTSLVLLLWQAAHLSEMAKGTLQRRPNLVLRVQPWINAAPQDTLVDAVAGAANERAQSCRTAPNLLLPLLRSSLVLRSARTLLPERQGITLVTHTSMDRLPMVERQCALWPERLAVAVYAAFAADYGLVSSNATMQRWPEGKAMELVAALHRRTEADVTACALDVHLFSEDFAGERLSRARHKAFPINAVRNRALQLVRTDAVALLDADFLPSAALATLVGEYRRGDGAGKALMIELHASHVLYVLPAFETKAGIDNGGMQVALDAAVGGKATVAAALANGSLEGFTATIYPPGHRATDFARWVTASDPYEVQYEEGFEPYVLTLRRHVPWYDERFFWHGYNKIQHLAHLRSLGVRWMVHPTGYLVHQPHADSPSKAFTHVLGGHRVQKELFLTELRPQMLNGTFVPVATIPEECRDVDLDLGLGTPNVSAAPKVVQTAVVNWLPVHQEVMASLVYHFQRLGHNVTAFQTKAASFKMGLAMHSFYQREMHDGGRFQAAASGFDVVVIASLGYCPQLKICADLAAAINGSRPARLFFIVHNPPEVLQVLPLMRPEAARGVHVLTLAPHINTAVNQLMERERYGDLPNAQWLAPIFPIVLPEECGPGKAIFDNNVLDDASSAPSAAVDRVACNRSALWQTVAMPPPEQQRLSFCLQGNLESSRRNYSGLFGDMAARTAEFSAAGVSLVLQGNPVSMELPKQLLDQRLVRIYESLPFQEYYELLHSCRATLTSFTDDIYLTTKASSSVAAALLSGVPLVASRRLLQAYSYLALDAVFLMEDGMADAEAMARVAALPDEQAHAVAAAVGRLQKRLFRRNVDALRHMMA